MSSNVRYFRQVPVEQYYSFFLKPAGSTTAFYSRPHKIKVLLFTYFRWLDCSFTSSKIETRSNLKEREFAVYYKIYSFCVIFSKVRGAFKF